MTGFSKSDKFLEIHWPAQFGEQQIDQYTIAESLTRLAGKLTDEHSDARAIVTVSWLLDHPKFKDLFGMKIIGEGDDNWRQLIGSDRQIRQDRVKTLLSTQKNALPESHRIYFSRRIFKKIFTEKKSEAVQCNAVIIDKIL